MREGFTYEEMVEYIEALPRFRAGSSPEDTRRLLRRLGSPDRGLRIIHVAGSNGKGSVCAYLKSILEAAGYRVGVFTSPHLVDMRERFGIGACMVSRERFAAAFQRVYEQQDAEQATFFEYLFLMGMLIFAEEKPDFCILETGLGGRLDATNAVESKELCVITRLSLEHTQYLGDTMEKIAAEKAGILKKGVRAVFADTDEKVTKTILDRAKMLGCEAEGVSKNDYRVLNLRNKSIDFSYVSRYDKHVYENLCLHTIARYQAENCALALRAAELLHPGGELSEEVLRRGVENGFHAGRMEEVLADTYVDGAHNEDGIRAFLEAVAQDGHVGKRTLLFGVVSDKEYGKMLGAIGCSGLFDRLVVAHLKNKRGASFEELEAHLQQVRAYRGEHYDSVRAALADCLEHREKGERIYAAGSLYLVGEIKEFLRND